VVFRSPCEFRVHSVSTIWLHDHAVELARAAADDELISSVGVEVVEPGDPVRVINVMDGVIPSCKEQPDDTFPGLLGPLAPAGTGVTHRIDGVSVLSCARLAGMDERPLHEQEALVDMAGPGADTSPFAATTNVVLTFEQAPGSDPVEADQAIRLATLRTARDLAAAVRAQEPIRVEQVEAAPAAADAPAIALLLHLGALGPLFNSYLYGTETRNSLATLLEPAEVLDGAITGGNYHWAALRNTTASYQRSALVRGLLDAEREGRLRIAGVLAVNAYNNSSHAKERSALVAAKVARSLGADGAIVTTEGGGNSHTDTMLTVRACERLGIRTTALVCEMADPDSTSPGLTDHVPEADCLVSVGNAEELVGAWAPERVIGGDELLDGGSPYDAAPQPVRNYLGATNQMGDFDLRAATW
jgi:glycine reductase complex component B subunit alpha and beta